KEAEAERLATAAERVTQARAEEESFAAEAAAEVARAAREKASQQADIVVPAEVERERVRTLAEAEADRIRFVKGGEADGQRLLMEAEAMGLLALLTRRAEGLGELVDRTGGEAQLAALMLIAEQLPALVAEQVKAISNLKIDQVTVWDSGGGNGGNGGSSTANFLSSLIGSLPPLQDLAGQVGVKLPAYLGEMDGTTPENLRDLADAMEAEDAADGEAD
ncbi:MAG: flotillin family protein, partial [bacterium]|nr:flotillin family protein [bacterium]